MPVTRRQHIEQLIEKLQAELKQLKASPEPSSSSPTVLFERRDYWYITGPVGGSTQRTWEELVEWLSNDPRGLEAANLRVVVSTLSLDGAQW